MNNRASDRAILKPRRPSWCPRISVLSPFTSGSEEYPQTGLFRADPGLQVDPVGPDVYERSRREVLSIQGLVRLLEALGELADPPRGQWMGAAGLGDAPRRLPEEFAKIKSGDMVLKARRVASPERPVRVRCVTTPDKPQKVLRRRLGLTLPQPLRTVEEATRM